MIKVEVTVTKSVNCFLLMIEANQSHIYLSRLHLWKMKLKKMKLAIFVEIKPHPAHKMVQRGAIGSLQMLLFCSSILFLRVLFFSNDQCAFQVIKSDISWSKCKTIINYRLIFYFLMITRNHTTARYFDIKLLIVYSVTCAKL